MHELKATGHGLAWLHGCDLREWRWETSMKLARSTRRVEVSVDSIRFQCGTSVGPVQRARLSYIDVETGDCMAEQRGSRWW